MRNSENAGAGCAATCTFLGMFAGATYGWVQLMLQLKQHDNWSDTNIILLSLLGPGEAAVALTALAGSCALIGVGACLYGAGSSLFSKSSDRAALLSDPQKDYNVVATAANKV